MQRKRTPVDRDLYAELSKKRTARIYLFLGENDGEKDKAIKRIAGLLLKEDEAEHALGRFHCEAGELMQAADFALSQSMFSDAHVCVMLNVEAALGVSSGAKLLDEVLSSLPDSTTLIMTTSANRPPKGLESVPGMGVFQFWPPFENDLAAYIVRTLKAEEIDIDAGAARSLVELLGRDLRAVDGALEKLRNFGAERLTEETVLSVVGGSREDSLFEFVDSLFRGDRSSLGQLKNLIENRCPELLILNQICRRADSIERFHMAVRGGENEEEALKKASVLPRSGGVFVEMARANPIKKIKLIYPLLAAADSALKSNRSYKSVVSNPLFDLSYSILSIGSRRARE